MARRSFRLSELLEGRIAEASATTAIPHLRHSSGGQSKTNSKGVTNRRICRKLNRRWRESDSHRYGEVMSSGGQTDVLFPSQLSRVRECRDNRVGCQRGILGEQSVLRYASCQIVQHDRDRNTRPYDARHTVHDVGVHRNVIAPIHRFLIPWLQYTRIARRAHACRSETNRTLEHAVCKIPISVAI